MKKDTLFDAIDAIDNEIVEEARDFSNTWSTN